MSFGTITSILKQFTVIVMKSNNDCISYTKIWLFEFSGHLESEYTISRIFKKICKGMSLSVIRISS